MNRFLALIVVALVGCASQQPQLSVAKFDASPRPPTKRVEYFEDETMIRKPFTIIAVISVPGEGADVQSASLTKVLGLALDEARKLGAEALVLHRTNPSGTGAAQTLYKAIVFSPPPPGAVTR
jgi:hypothetical protein